MKWLNSFLFATVVTLNVACQSPKQEEKKMEKIEVKYNDLSPEESRVINDKGTERAFTGEYTDKFDKGIYACKKCNAPLYVSEDKFHSSCGWPSFDDEIEGAVKRTIDADGRRTEITCANCDGHLGHVFLGEGFTDKNTRHCVNSISLEFYPSADSVPALITAPNLDTAIFASGCFWGTEYHFMKKEGVISTEVGYIGGVVPNPSYEQVCTGKTGHAEACRVVYDANKVSFEDLTKLFFETHDPSQINRQGPDIGTQYRTEIFYLNDEQKEVSEKLIKILEDKGVKVATKLTPASDFYSAEGYHQEYYDKKGSTPYCHIYQKKFD